LPGFGVTKYKLESTELQTECCMTQFNDAITMSSIKLIIYCADNYIPCRILNSDCNTNGLVASINSQYLEKYHLSGLRVQQTQLNYKGKPWQLSTVDLKSLKPIVNLCGHNRQFFCAMPMVNSVLQHQDLVDSRMSFIYYTVTPDPGKQFCSILITH